MKYAFNIPLTPRIKKNSRPIFRNKKTGKPFLGKSSGLKEYEEHCILILQSQKNQQALKEPLQGNLWAYFEFNFKGACRADFDNLITTVCDVLQASRVILNDKQIKSGSWAVKENRGDFDSTWIEISQIESV